MSKDHQHEQWGTRLGVILAVAGSAVGLGNFLRFPGQAAQNRGGAFMIPYFAALGSFKTWLAAAGQIFFTLSVGFGVILNYAAYMKKGDDLVLSALTASSTNELFEVGFGGMITLTASFVFLGLTATIAAVQTGTFGLGFNTLPVVFAHMGPLGNFIGATWFLMLFLAAITSSISMYQPTIAFFREAVGMGRNAATTLLAVLAIVGGMMVLYFSRGLVFLDTLDFWVGTFLIFVLAMVQIICFSWIHGIERGMQEAHEGAHIRIPGPIRFVMKWVTPLYLIVVFVGFCTQNLAGYFKNAMSDHEAQLALGWIVANAVMLLVMLAMGIRRWRAAGIDIDDRKPSH